MTSKRRWGIAALLVVVLVAAGLAYLRVTGHAPGEVAELVGQGGEKALREPMRAARGAPRVLIFALDGVGADELEAVIRGGRARSLAALVGAPAGEAGVYAHAYAAPGVLSILPSTTYATWTSLFTGEPAARTGVPGNEWFAREEDRFYSPGLVTVSALGDALRVYTDGLMGQVTRVPTLYERAGVRSYVSLAGLHRGADLVTVPAPAALGDVLVEGVEALSEGDVEREVYEELDATAVGSLLATIEKRGVADLQVVYFPGVDLWTHVAPDPLADERRYIEEVIDRAVGDILGAYRRRGALEGTYVLFVADHGQTPVLNDDRHSLGTDGDDEPPALLRKLGFRVRPFELEIAEEERDHQAVVAYQGGFAYVYLADRSGCPAKGDRCDWRRPPRFAEDVIPVARAFHEASRTGAGVPELRGAIDLVFAREPRPVGQETAPFQVWDGNRLVPIRDYLAANPRPELLRLEERLRDLAVGPYGHHAGDVLLMARNGMHLPIGQRFYFSEVYHSWHGTATDQDSRIPLVVALPGGDGRAIREAVRRAVGERPTQLSITPLVLSLLGRSAGGDSASAARGVDR
ncbi:MAG TPA: alkaline phosphatase family protein [Longimicrobium sp.]|nr:alkaline phosphatase family protein [Longimicrobium sp.]